MEFCFGFKHAITEGNAHPANGQGRDWKDGRGTTGSRPAMTAQLLVDSEAEPPVTNGFGFIATAALAEWTLIPVRSGCVMG